MVFEGVFGGFWGGSWGSRVALGPPWAPPRSRGCVWWRPKASRELPGRLQGASGSLAKASQEPPGRLPWSSQESLGSRPGACTPRPHSALLSNKLEWISPLDSFPAHRQSVQTWKPAPIQKFGSSPNAHAFHCIKPNNCFNPNNTDVRTMREERGRQNGRSPHESHELMEPRLVGPLNH